MQRNMASLNEVDGKSCMVWIYGT